MSIAGLIVFAVVYIVATGAMVHCVHRFFANRQQLTHMPTLPRHGGRMLVSIMTVGLTLVMGGAFEASLIYLIPMAAVSLVAYTAARSRGDSDSNAYRRSVDRKETLRVMPDRDTHPAKQ